MALCPISALCDTFPFISWWSTKPPYISLSLCLSVPSNTHMLPSLQYGLIESDTKLLINTQTHCCCRNILNKLSLFLVGPASRQMQSHCCSHTVCAFIALCYKVVNNAQLMHNLMHNGYGKISEHFPLKKHMLIEVCYNYTSYTKNK